MQKFILAIVALLLFATTGIFHGCQSEMEMGKQQSDWLINGSRFVAKVSASDDGKELVLHNGLIERKFRVEPNFACISIRNLVTGENYLRSVRPEAQITLDGFSYNIGGLLGQPVHNYLLPEWIENLTNDEEAFQFTGYAIGDIKPRFGWKIRKEWLSGEVQWPAPGKELVVDFHAPVAIRKDDERQIIYTDDFSKLDQGWIVHASNSHERNSFINEGKPGQIMAHENSAVFAERPFPEGARVVQGIFNPGTDRSASWGSGITLVYGHKNIKLNLKPRRGRFGIWNGSEESEAGQLKDGAEYHLRMIMHNNHVWCEGSEDGKNWQELAKIYSPEIPVAVRIGKTDPSGGNTDAGNSGNLERSQIRHFTILGEPVEKQEAAGIKGIVVKVHYEIYDGLPLISKWITVENSMGNPVMLNSFTSEIIAAVEGESSVEGEPVWELPNIHVETDFAFSGMSNRRTSSSTVHWVSDPLYSTQVHYPRQTPCLLEVRPSLGPAQEIKPAGVFQSFRVWELFFDSHDKERKGLSQRKMYRTISPWVTENPILMHVRQADPESVKLAIDQCAEVGFEMVIMTFGSGFNMESGDPVYYQKMKELAGYAHDRGIALGGYSLLASRAISEKDDVINPATGKRGGIAQFGNSPCLGSEWGIEYFRKIKEMYEVTGLDIIEHDGSYPGDVCGSTSHPGHRGPEDSQWNQFRTISDFYRWCREQGIYLNIPDWYYLNGASKCAMGYRETNWSLPRAQQEIIERQNIYDGTWTKTPSMGWMFVPLTEYQGGGAAATIEPLNQHLEHYAQRMANLFGAGVQACYRGPRLYDTDETKAVVQHWVDFYKKHRQVLDADIIHLRRPDGQDWDGLLHVNPMGAEKGFIMLYNPLNEEIIRNINVPIYYTGLSSKVNVTSSQGITKTYRISRDYEIPLQVNIPARGYTYYILK
ncbi:hypothetical protein [Gaoshiqia sp. Z1-71]|uniref:hypothetical protein n=1 Tax=Gaoshiqia hydrogeniformans TaxID=3290090 RepID=UPI003BF8E182